MNKLRPIHLRRSWLFVGAATENHIDEANKSPADVCIQEFEDFCVPERREFARKIMPEVIATWKKSGKVAAVRINPLEDPDGIKDLRAAISANVDSVLLPKANYSYQIDKLIKHINDLEKEFGKEINSTEIVPNIEQAIGLENALSILEKKTRVVASLVASEDMSVSLKSPRNKNSKILNYVRERFHVACCAANVISIDMPYIWADNDGVKMQAELARDIGMLSKSTVNAGHCEIINNIFSPTTEQLEKAKSHVEVFEKARKLGQGQVDFDGVRIEMPTYLNALEVIKRFNELKNFIVD